jgi:purine nucleosidase
MKIPILLDTDPGSDIDDAVALAYLLAYPDCELVGITTVTGDTQKRAAICDAVCRDFGRTDIPIYAGLSETRGPGRGQPLVPHYDALPPSDRSFPTNAVEFLRDAIRSRPGEITLLTVGPLTNFAALLDLDPEIPALCKQIVMMAGSSFDGHHHEWNCIVDPTATERVFGAVDQLTAIGLDVTLKCQLTPAETDARFTDPRFASVRKMAAKWFSDVSHITFHDPLAAAVIFHPELCEFETGRIEIGPEGMTTFVAGAGGHRYAKTVDTNGFFSEYFRRFS